MSTIAAEVSSRYSDVKPEKRVKKSNPFSIKSWWEGQKFEKVWDERNLENGDVFINSIEVDFLEFDQDYFVQHSKELMEKPLIVALPVCEVSGISNQPLLTVVVPP